MLPPFLYTLSETTAVGTTIDRKTSYSMFASLCAMIINIIGNYLLVLNYGAFGAAISTVFAFWELYIIRTELSGEICLDIEHT